MLGTDSLLHAEQSHLLTDHSKQLFEACQARVAWQLGLECTSAP